MAADKEVWLNFLSKTKTLLTIKLELKINSKTLLTIMFQQVFAFLLFFMFDVLFSPFLFPFI